MSNNRKEKIKSCAVFRIDATLLLENDSVHGAFSVAFFEQSEINSHSQPFPAIRTFSCGFWAEVLATTQIGQQWNGHGENA
jgi:hypothetical protein